MTTTAARVGTRLRSDMSRILVEQPMVASTALFMEHRERTRHEPGMIACTDGRSVTIWPSFHEMVEAERIGVLLHEYLHVAFAHPLRGAKLRRRLGDAYRHDVLNVAADAIINEGIRKGGRATIKLPAGGVELLKLADMAEKICALTGLDVDHQRMRNVAKLTMEWLYDALVRLRDAAEDACAQDDAHPSGRAHGQGMPADGSDTATTEQSRREQVQRQSRLEAARTFLEQFAGRQDLDVSAGSAMTQGDLDDAIREAGEKLRNAASMGRGSRASSIIEQLEADIPQVSTPWEAAFRSVTQKHLSRQRLRSPTRPARRMLSQEAAGFVNIAWSAGRRRANVPRVVVVLDSSGSIRKEDYLRYLGEIQAMKKRTNAQVYAIVADAAIQSVQEIKDVADILSVEFKGRGGTDFRPALALAADLDADLVVYLTDLMGTFPDETPAFPVIWTHPGSEIPDGYTPPFGRVLHLD
jgi:predicted metal-dependent peptidase